MDFSSVTRALDSLKRRNPPLHDTILSRTNDLIESLVVHNDATNANDRTTKLLDTIQYYITTPIPTGSRTTEGEDNTANNNVVVTSAGIVTQTGYRWEPLAVGLYIATEVLNRQDYDGNVNPVAGMDDTIADVIAKGANSNKDNNDDDDEDSVNGISATKGIIPSCNVVAGGGSTVYVDGPRVPSVVSTQAVSQIQLPVLDLQQIASLCTILHEAAVTNLEHKEPRVRTLIAKCIGAYAKIPNTIWFNSTASIESLHTRIVTSIHEHIELGRDENGNYSRSTTGALDDTTGWRALETNWLALASMVASLQGSYLATFGIPLVILQDCEFSAIKHVNRHVRAAAMACLEQMIHSCKVAYNTGNSELRDKVTEILLQPISNSTAVVRKTTVAVASAGLADNWSQVRMAASVLSRVLFVTLSDLGHTSVDDIHAILLPRMCLNRFYLAQGVKIYSHETWKIIFYESSGLPKIIDNLPAVCRYYIKMCDADNHAVREAACQAIAELAIRLGQSPTYRDTLRSYIDMLLQALVMCFHDESWPVRDEACLACGIICKAYPDECRSELKLLWDRWTEQLTDQIWSVREDAAVALGDALEAYGPEFLDKLRDLIRKILPAARDQPAMTRDDYKKHVNDIESHSNTQLYSCGSLAPKLRKGGAGRIGCSSCGIDRPKAPWEATDGCIYLIRELCYKCCLPTDGSQPVRTDIQLSDAELKPLLQELADVCRVQHFPQADELRATLWRCLPAMAHAIGKDRFKRYYLDIFMDLLFANIDSRSASQLSIHAAGQCAEELASFVGVPIFRGRLEDYQIAIFDRTMRERHLMPKGPSGGAASLADSFSPFGPNDLLSTVYK